MSGLNIYVYVLGMDDSTVRADGYLFDVGSTLTLPGFFQGPRSGGDVCFPAMGDFTLNSYLLVNG